MEEGVRLGDYSAKEKYDRVVSGEIGLDRGNVGKTRERSSVSAGKSENKTQIHEDKKEKKHPRLILSDSETDEDFGTDQNVNGSVERKPIRIRTVNRIERGGTGRNIIRIGGYKRSEKGGIDRKEITVEPSFRKMDGSVDGKRIKFDNFGYREKSGIGRNAIDVKVGAFRRKEGANFGRSEIKVDHFKCRGEIEDDRKTIEVDPFKEAGIKRRQGTVIDSFKCREENETERKRIKIGPVKCREEDAIDRKRITIVPIRSRKESEDKASGVNDVKLVTYVRQREGRKERRGNNLSDMQSPEAIMGNKDIDNVVIERQRRADHMNVQEYRMLKATPSHLGGIAKEKLRLSVNHSVRLQGTGGVLKILPSRKKPASGFPEVSHSHRRAERTVRNGSLEAILPMQKKVSHQPPGLDPKSSVLFSTVAKKIQGGRPSIFLTGKTRKQKPKSSNIPMPSISPKSGKLSDGETGSTLESSGVHIDVVPLSSKKMETKLADVAPFLSKKLKMKQVDRVPLSSKRMEAKHADVAPLLSKNMKTKHADGFPSSSKMMETKEPLSSKKMETEHVDAVPLLGKKQETKMEEALRLRQERMLLRQRLKEMVLDAGWKIELRPRKGKNYRDSIYISPEGTAYWSIVNAYNALYNESIGGDKEMEIPMEDLSILTRITKARMMKEMGESKDGKVSKKIKKHAGRFRSCKVRDGSQRKHLKGATKPQSKKKKHAKENMDTCLHRVQLNSGGKKKNSRGCALMVRGSSKGAPNLDDLFIPYSGKRNVISWLIDSGVVPENGKLQYMNKKHTRVMMEGWITRDGIHCSCCSKILTVSKFEIHAGSKLRQPYQNIFLENGISLMQCQLKAWDAQNESERRGFHVVDLDGSDENDDTCGICGDGGDLICCDGCPSTFHLSCLDLQSLPPGDWHCPHCSCRFCGVVVGTDQDEGATLPQIVSCTQCEQKYHRECAGENDAMPAGSTVPHATFCGKDCQELFKRLQDLLGVKNDLDGGFSWTLIRRFDEDPEMSRRGLAQRAECNSKIAVAFTVMDECFMPIIDQRSRINMIHNVVYNCSSNFNRLNYRGFYTVLLERGDDFISAASIRIHGSRLAEMPLIGTRHIHRRQGMCRRLVNAIESVLRSLKVEKLIIPAISELMRTWTVVFGFKPLEEWHKREMRSMNMMVFPGTDLLQKQLFKHDTEALGVADVVNELKCCQNSTPEIANQCLVVSAVEPIVDAAREGNLCDESEVTESEKAPYAGSEHASAEHNGSEVMPSIPFEDSDTMYTDVSELKCSQNTAPEIANQSLVVSAVEPIFDAPSEGNLCDESDITGSKKDPNAGSDHASAEHIVEIIGSEALPSIPFEDSDSMCTVCNALECSKDICDVEVEAVAIESILPSYSEESVRYASDVNSNTLDAASKPKFQPSVPDIENSTLEPVTMSLEDGNNSPLTCAEPNFTAFVEHNVTSCLMDTVLHTSDSVNGTREAAPDAACIPPSDGVSACDASVAIGLIYAAHLGTNHATGGHINDAVSESKCIEEDFIELENASLMTSFVEVNPHSFYEVTVDDTCEINVEAAAVEPYLPDIGEASRGHNSTFSTKSAEADSRSNFQSCEDSMTYTSESYEGPNNPQESSLFESNRHGSSEVTLDYEASVKSPVVSNTDLMSSGDDILCYMPELIYKYPEVSSNGTLLLASDEGYVCDTSDVIGSREVEALTSIPFEGTDIACTTL